MKLSSAMITIMQNERLKIHEMLAWTLRELHHHRELKARYMRTNAFWCFAKEEQKHIEVIIEHYPQAVLRYQGIIEIFDHVIQNGTISDSQIQTLSECEIPKIIGIAYDLHILKTQQFTH
ncbi:MAG: hypothetical protein HYX61_08505 [Gammaproteobacteria bacterium]|jgi:hypothetical protein|nr:hypothetical protein [Gammaproteobacteria bacterium]